MLAKRLLGKRATKPSIFRIALLEILIIIVGILLSVAITEWFGNRKNDKQEAAYLENIAKDLTNDLEFLQNELEQRSDQLEACQNLLKALGQNKDENFSSEEAPRAFKVLANTVRFSPSTATFRALESTGRMELIDNDNIVRQLIDLYTGDYDMLDQNNDDVTRYRDNFLLPFMVSNLNFSTVVSRGPVKNPLLNTDPATLIEMNNHIIYNQISLSSTVTAYKRAIKQVQETLVLVEQELE